MAGWLAGLGCVSATPLAGCMDACVADISGYWLGIIRHDMGGGVAHIADLGGWLACLLACLLAWLL